MQKFLLRVFLLASLGSFNVKAMNNEDPWQLLMLDIIAAQADLEIEDYCHLAASNTKWHKVISSDDFWQVIYGRLKNDYCKIKKELSYKQNFKILFFDQIRVSVHGLEGCPLTFDCPWVKQSRIKIQEIITQPEAMSEDHYGNFLSEALSENIKIYGSSWGFYTGGPAMADSLKKVLDLSLSKDVLMVFPAGNDGIHCQSDALGFDLHEAYPNVLWVGACSAEGVLEHFSNFGPFIDIAAPSSHAGKKGTTLSALSVIQLVVPLRALRADLTAAEIRSLLIESSDRTEESKNKIPRGGILNCEAAITAVKRYAAK